MVVTLNQFCSKVNPVFNRTVHRFHRILKADIKDKVHPCRGTEALYRPYGP